MMTSSIWQYGLSMGEPHEQCTIGGVTLTWGSSTDVGLVRSVNEDSVLAKPPVFLVADGMGGHDAGDVASMLAASTIGSMVENPPSSTEEVASLIAAANAEILVAGASQSEEKAMGTTAVGLVLVASAAGPVWMLFNIGDSRVYRFSSGTLEQLSKDHSYVQELVDAGQITPAAALTHPQRNVVTRALGVEPEVQADLWVRSPMPGERFLLCSDGLSGEVGDAVIAATLGGGGRPQALCDDLVRTALESGARDNVSVLVIDVESVDGVDADDYITAPRDEPTREHDPVSMLPSATRPTARDMRQSQGHLDEGLDLLEVPKALFDAAEAVGADASEGEVGDPVGSEPPAMIESVPGDWSNGTAANDHEHLGSVPEPEVPDGPNESVNRTGDG